jgi:hypothetical protein
MLESNPPDATLPKGSFLNGPSAGISDAGGFFAFGNRASKNSSEPIRMNEPQHKSTQSSLQQGVPVNAVNGDAPLLDTQETTMQPKFASSYRDFLTSGIQPDIEFNEQVYTAIDERDEKHRRQAYNACRTSAWFVRHRVTGRIRVASSRCSLRWCPLCIKTKRFVMVRSLIPWVQAAKKPKFITLTLRHSNADLEFQVDNLYKFFSNLRRRPYWKKRISGGIWFFQIKKSKSDGLWHPHLHIIAQGRYVPHAELSDIWTEITHGSSIVDIRAVKNPKKASEYVARYASAPCRLSDLDLDDAVTVVDALHGRRICGTFGTGKEIQLVPQKCPDSDEWEFMSGFATVMYNRNRSDWHNEIYRAFVKEDFCYSYPENPPPAEVNLLEQLQESPITFKQLVFEWSA